MPHHPPPTTSELGTEPVLEGAQERLVGRSDDMTRSHQRLRDLIRVNNDLVSNLDLETLLRRIVELGTELVHAEYGAMGVIDAEQGLAQLITVGMDEQTVARIGRLPDGKGLLGAMISDPRPVRLADLGDDARSIGFPAHHPPMRSFLGVPIRVRDTIYGNLYLADSREGEFSADDEELAGALAATAGTAIANARLYEHSLYRERWASALAETARRLMQDDDDKHLGFLLGQVRELGEADLACVLRLSADGDDLIVDRAIGVGAENLQSTSVPVVGSVSGRALRSGQPVLVHDVPPPEESAPEPPTVLGPFMAIPFAVGAAPGGVLSLARLSGRPDFTSRDLDMGQSFASHISVSIERARSRLVHRRVALLEDRSRIARDLHDHVIQRLFATGLNLQATASGLTPDDAEDVMQQIREIDASIAQIRQSIFALNRDAEVTTVSLRARVLEIVERMQVDGQSRTRTQIAFLGPVDLIADADLADDVSAVVTEALANVARHAEADEVDVVISAAAGQVSVEVTDDGIGPGSSRRFSGLANLRARAEGYGGTFELLPAPSGGSRLVWSVPV